MTTLEVVKHTSCRLCKSKELTEAFSIGNQFINDFVDKEDIGKGRKAPLDLMICNSCSLIQLRHTAPQELLYSGFYWYRSGVTQTMLDALTDVSRAAEQEVDLQAGDIVLDIGANDGTQLKTYSNPDLIRVGCEPANNLIDSLRETTPHAMHDFWEYKSYKKHLATWNLPTDQKAKVITALGMFYDMEDPNQFVRDAASALHEDGVFIAQLMCLASMLEKNDIGNICHEHIEYYSLKSLQYLFENNGLEIYKIEENLVNGGSYRLFGRHYKEGSISFDEDYQLKDLLDFKKRIDENRDQCVAFITKEVEKGKKVYIYGASTKGNAVLQYYGLDTEMISGAAERSPEKFGKYTIGSWIPIFDEETARNEADYFFVLPYAFFDEMYEREAEWRSKGGKFILSTPEFRVVE